MGADDIFRSLFEWEHCILIADCVSHERFLSNLLDLSVFVGRSVGWCVPIAFAVVILDGCLLHKGPNAENY